MLWCCSITQLIPDTLCSRRNSNRPYISFPLWFGCIRKLVFACLIIYTHGSEVSTGKFSGSRSRSRSRGPQRSRARAPQRPSSPRLPSDPGDPRPRAPANPYAPRARPAPEIAGLNTPKMCYDCIDPFKVLSAPGGTAISADREALKEQQITQMEVLWHPTGNI